MSGIMEDRELIALLRREGQHSGVWFGPRLLDAADRLEATATPAQPLDAATIERCARAIDQAYNERIEQKKAASSRSDSAAKREARDFESMALQASMDAARVRALATEPHQHGGKGA